MSLIFKDGTMALLLTWMKAPLPQWESLTLIRLLCYFKLATVRDCSDQGIAIRESQVLLELSAGTVWDLLLFSDVWQVQYLKAPLRQGWCCCILPQGSAISSCQVPNP